MIILPGCQLTGYSWTCFSGICEVARQGVNTQPFTTSLPATLIASSTAGPSSNSGTPSSSNTAVSGAGEQPTAAVDGETSSTNHKNESSSSQKSVIAAAVLGVICLCLGAGIAILVWRRRRRTGERTHVASDLPPTEQYNRRSVVAPVLTSGTLGNRPVPFLVTQASPSATTSLKNPGTFSRGVREDAVPERLVIPGPRRSNVASWQTDSLPPSYVHDSRVG
ncbi:hypothetical protein GGX14DRAFT_462701 [Mycena pura]|uniref:Uncharacterized protein n=1 Tax=Mycena pura TaxID=153505 RepID=A0AAD6Y5R5_9AGAR|nr:hypothetical protein GGX14DRAFT_462701 [Mycena pura]